MYLANTRKLIIVVSSFFLWNVAFAQHNLGIDSFKDSIEKELGIDQRIFTGRFYVDLTKYDTGHPFFRSSNWLKGSVQIRNTTFSEILLKFDIANQELIVSRKDIIDKQLAYVLPLFDVNTFVLDDHLFEKVKSPNGEQKFCLKVFDNNEFGILVFWYKTKIKSNQNSISIGYKYSNPKTSVLVKRIDGSTAEIKRNKALLNFIEEQERKTAKKFIKKEKINVKSIEPDKLKDFMKKFQTSFDIKTQ